MASTLQVLAAVSFVEQTIIWVPTANSYDDFHKIFWVFIALLGSLLRTTHKPFEYPKVVAFVATIAIYFISLVIELALRTNGIYHIIVNKLSLFSGSLAVILPILIIVPAIGWLALGIWVCVFGIVVYRFYDKIRDDFVKIVAEVRSIMNQLRNGNANGSQGEPNASANESMGSSAVTMPVNVV